MKPQAAIFDRDGTLASVHNAPTTRSNESWAAYNAALPFDRPVPEVVALLNSIRPGVIRIMVSGRAQGNKPGENFRYWQMWQWIHKNNLPIDRLYMRQAGDQRRDSVIKEEILVNQILPYYIPVVAVDDREAVCEVWRRHDIHVVKVTNPGAPPAIGEYNRYWNQSPKACIPECKIDPKHVGCCFR